MKALSKAVVTIVGTQLYYWWTGLLLAWARHRTNWIVNRGYRKARGRWTCENACE